MLSERDDASEEFGRLIREWTDSAERAATWTDEARALVATTDHTRQPFRVFALVGGLTVLVVAAGLTIRHLAGLPDEAASSTSPSPSARPMASPTPAPTPNILAGKELPLSELAWWDEEHISFGFIPEWTPPPDPATQPPNHKLVHIGTLDGRVTAVVALDAQWSHSYVSGPVGTDVLITNDVGGYSRVEVVSALDGSRTALFVSDAIIPAAVLSPDGSEVFYGKFNRTTGADEGLWRQPRSRGPESLVLAGPLGEPLESINNLTIWRLTFSLDGRTIVAQSCFGEARCTSHFVDVETGSARSIESIGWIRGVTDREVIARDLGVDVTRLVGVDLQTLERRVFEVQWPASMPVRVGGSWHLAYSAGEAGTGESRLFSIDEEVEIPIPGGEGDQPETGIEDLMERKGVSLPEGWVIRWPQLIWAPPWSLDAIAAAQLVNVITGERLLLPAFQSVVTSPACSLIPPARMPSGRLAGTYIQTLESGVVFAQWGSAEDVVFEAAGALISPELASPESIDVTVRGNPGHAADIGGEFSSQGAFAWEEAGCQYSVWLGLGTSVEAAIEYAARY